MLWSVIQHCLANATATSLDTIRNGRWSPEREREREREGGNQKKGCGQRNKGVVLKGRGSGCNMNVLYSLFFFPMLSIDIIIVHCKEPHPPSVYTFFVFLKS